MHKTGVFVHNPTSFSEKDLGNDTATYLKLIHKMSDSRWTAFYSALKTIAEIVNELKKLSKANLEPLPNEPEEGYHIHDSDPIDPNKNINLDLE